MNKQIHHGFIPESESNALSLHIKSQSNYFWRGKKLLRRGITEKDTPAFPIWQVAKEILDFVDMDDEFIFGVKKQYELLFNRIIYKGMVRFRGETLEHSSYNFGETLGGLLLILLNKKYDS